MFWRNLAPRCAQSPTSCELEPSSPLRWRASSERFAACDQGGEPDEKTSGAGGGGKADDVCPLITDCGIACTFGFAVDEDGCELCACAPPPICGLEGPQTCDNVCPNGFATDAQGCQTCECLPDPTCEPFFDCGLGVCPFGFATDDDGCELCACADPPGCLPLPCPGFCEFGTVADDDGCPTCECAPAPECPLNVNCGIFCPFGNAVDEDGCEQCSCAPAPGCIDFECDIVCPDGFATDPTDGCPVCECA